MLRAIAELIMPIFTQMGVSEADVYHYTEILGGYIFAILGTLLLAVIVIVAAQFLVKKGSRLLTSWTAIVAWVVIATIVVNVVCFGPMYNNIAPILNGGAEVSEESVAASREIIEQIGNEGIVMVKNDENLLPLSNTKNLNVFGWASVSPIFGGTGSGSTDVSQCVDILEALQEAGFTTNQSLSDMYMNYQPKAGNVGIDVTFTDWSLAEPPIEYYTDELMAEAESFSDVAVVVIARSGGEGQDEPLDMNAVINGTYDIRDQVANGNSNYAYFNAAYANNGDYDDFDAGEHYLELSNTEEAMIEKVCSSFEKVIVVINANNTMELGWVDAYENIDAVLLCPGAGATAFKGLGSIMNGSVNPSGHTADTYVYDLTTTPYYNNFGSFIYNNVDDLNAVLTEADGAYQGVQAFVNYVEGIYVGYRFYETAAEEGLINYDEIVQYPFGYGLSYTTFTQEITNFVHSGDTVTVEVTVTNTGDVAGKDVVQLYYTPPYYNGGIEKASVNLLDFDKTEVLAPGASEVVTFEFNVEDMASYDSSCIKTANGGYILEAGEYILSVRANSHDVLDTETLTVESDIDYSVAGRTSDEAVATNQFEFYSAGDVTYLSRADGFANYDEATAAPVNFEMSDELRAVIEKKAFGYYDPTLYDDPNAVMPTTGASNGIVLSEMTGVSYDDEKWELLLDQLTVEDMTLMVNLGGFQTVAIESIGKVGTLESDGGAGLNDWFIGVYGTPYTSGVLLAQTWNKELAEEVGSRIGAEFDDCGIYGWYGPSMNTHRTAFCGRNFEYYSEDGVLAGYIAGAMVNGAAKHGVYSYIKHFALNDQETNRCCFLQTHSTEQAIREIYLKPFELTIKNFTGSAQAVMSSFNFIGSVSSASNTYMLNNVLRGEWGFRGVVLSDWNGSYGYQITDDCIRNGNDLMLGFNMYESNVISDTDAASCVQALRQASKNILYTIANSGNYANEAGEGALDPMTKTFLMADIAIAAAVIVTEAIVIVLWNKKRKNAVNVERDAK